MGISDTIDSILWRVKSTYNNAKKIKDIPDDVFDKLKGDLNTIIRKVDKIDVGFIIREVVKAINANLGKYMTQLTDVMTDMINNVKEEFAAQFSNLSSKFNQLGTIMETKINEVYVWLQDLGAQIAEIAGNVVNPIKDFALNVWHKFAPWLAGVILVLLFPVYSPFIKTAFDIFF